MPAPFRPFPLLVAFVVVAVLPLVGCSRPDPTETAQSGDAAEEAAPADHARKAADENGGPNSGDDPATAFRRFADNLAAGRTSTIVDAVPKRVNDDLERLWDESVRPLDPSARRAAADSIAAFAEALSNKREFVLKSDRVDLEGTASGFIRRRFEAIAAVIASIARWPGWSAEGDDFEAPMLLEASVQTIVSESALKDELRSLRFETVTRNGSNAVVRIQSEDHTEQFEVSVVLIDGCWLPTQCVEWLSDTRPASAGAPPMDDTAARERSLQQLADQLREITTVLKGITTQDEFDAQADRAATLLMASAGRSIEPVRAVGNEELATIHVLGAISDEEKDRLLWAFVAQTDSPASGLADAVDRANGDGMTVTIGPIADLEKFAGRLSGVTVESIDHETRTITARVGEP